MSLASKESAKNLAQRVKAHRLGLNLTQAEVSARSRIPLATYQLFEHTGRITLERFASILNALKAQGELDAILKSPPVDFDKLWESKEPAKARSRATGRRGA